jgi:CHAD domain-containing protein
LAKARDIPDLHAELSYREAAARTVEVRSRELFDHADGVLDTSDIERVHDMRVATRRLRAVLEIYEPCFPRKQLRVALDEIKALADTLGERRDPDVQLAQLDEFAAAVKPADRPGVELFAERVRSEQRTANESLAAAIAELEETDLRGRLASLAASAEPAEPEPEPEPAEPEPQEPEAQEPALQEPEPQEPAPQETEGMDGDTR